jgi:hypothetical protein
VAHAAANQVNHGKTLFACDMRFFVAGCKPDSAACQLISPTPSQAIYEDQEQGKDVNWSGFH